MIMSGKRHPFQGTYTIGYDTAGRVIGLKLKMYCNGGHSLDVSHAVRVNKLL